MTWMVAIISSIVSVLFSSDEGIIGTLLMLESPKELTSIAKERESLPLANEYSFFKTPVVPILILGALLFCLQQLSGINVIIYFAPEIFNNLGFNTVTGQILAILGIGLINVLVTLIGRMGVDKIGRRHLLLFGFSGMFLSLLTLCLFSLMHPLWLPTLSIICLIIYMCSFAMSLGQIPHIAMSEIMPLSARASTLGNWALNTAVILSCPLLEKMMGIECTFILYVVICILGLMYAYFYRPNLLFRQELLPTKDRRLKKE